MENNDDMFLGLSLKKLKLKEVPEGDSMSELTFAAKNIKKILKTLCPDIKFSVKSSSFSMGNSITVSWEESKEYGYPGPKQEQLNKIEEAFVYIRRDSMMEEDTYIKPELAKYGKVKYLHFNRHDFTPAKIAQLEKEILTQVLNKEEVKPKQNNRL